MVNKKNTSQFKIISLRKLADGAKMDYNYLYNNLRGRYDSMEGSEKTVLCNVLHDELKAMGEFLNVDFIIKRKTRSK